jgi:hypothetical protein
LLRRDSDRTYKEIHRGIEFGKGNVNKEADSIGSLKGPFETASIYGYRD